MKAARIYLSAALFAVICQRSSSEEAASVERNALEEARREIQQLPRAEQPGVNSRGNLNEVNIPVPLLTPNRSSSPQQRAGTKSPASSNGWLLDALREREDRGRYSLAEKTASESRERKEQERRDTANPLGGYLRSWIRPSDHKLLVPETRSPGGVGGSSGPSWQPIDERSAAWSSAGSPKPHASASRRIEANPYLPASSDTSVFSEPVLVAPRAPIELAPAPAERRIETAVPLFAPSKAPETSLKTERANEERYAPPTAPLVDEKRYFPQLRKF
jgi:hypothetical protein